MAIPFLSGLRVHDSITLSDSKPIKWDTNNILSHNGTQTYLGDATSASVLTLNGGNATFAGDVTVESEHMIFKDGSPEFYFHTTGNHVNWLMAAQESTNACLEFSAVAASTSLSTTAGDYTPVLKLFQSGAATFAGDVTIGSTGAGSDKILNILTGGSDSTIKLMEAGTIYGFSQVYSGANNQFYIKRHSNSATGSAVITLNRDNDNTTFAGTITAARGSTNNNDDATETQLIDA